MVRIVVQQIALLGSEVALKNSNTVLNVRIVLLCIYSNLRTTLGFGQGPPGLAIAPSLSG